MFLVFWFCLWEGFVVESMGLREAMEAAAPSPGRRKLDVYLDRMGEEDAGLVVSWLGDRVGFSAHQIARALTMAGWPISATAVKDWRVQNGVGGEGR